MIRVSRLICFFFSFLFQLKKKANECKCFATPPSTIELERWLVWPVQEGVLNVVMGCNDGLLSDEHAICTAASCTTNCLAPVVKVKREGGRGAEIGGAVKQMLSERVHAVLAPSNDRNTSRLPYKSKALRFLLFPSFISVFPWKIVFPVAKVEEILISIPSFMVSPPFIPAQHNNLRRWYTL